jgi:ADP-ribose pyrophosphatase
LDIMKTNRHTASVSIEDATIIETEVLLPSPKRFLRERLAMPDGEQLDWYYIDTPLSVMVVPATNDGSVVLVRQYRHNLRRHTLEFPAGTAHKEEDPELAAVRELEEETGYVLAPGAEMRPLGAYSSLPSETNRYTHIFLANHVVPDGPARGDTEIEKYFDMSITKMPIKDAMEAIGNAICGTETITALMLARDAFARMNSGSC